MDSAAGGKRISPAPEPPPDDSFEAVQPPPEPADVDEPAPCPTPENSVMQVSNLSFAFKLQLLPSIINSSFAHMLNQSVVLGGILFNEAKVLLQFNS